MKPIFLAMVLLSLFSAYAGTELFYPWVTNNSLVKAPGPSSPCQERSFLSSSRTSYGSNGVKFNVKPF